MSISTAKYKMVSQESLLPEIPVLVTERIFSFLPLKDRLSCRLVCSEWYRIILKIGKCPNCFVIDGSQPKKQNVWQYFHNKKDNGHTMEMELEKGFLLKNFEDSLTPVEVLHIQSLNFLNWEKSFKNSDAFQETVRNITELHLKKITFSNGKILMQFLNKFEKLRHLALHHCEFDYRLVFAFLKDRMKRDKSACYFDSLDDISYPLESLEIEMTEDSFCMEVFISIFECKIKKSTLKSLALKVLPAKATFLQTLPKKYPEINGFLKQMLAMHQKSLKSLNVSWKSLTTKEVKVLENQQFQIPRLTPKATAFLANFNDMILPNCHLNLESLTLNIGCILDIAILSDFLIPLGEAETSFMPFLIQQVQKGLCLINLSISSICSPFPKLAGEAFEFKQLEKPEIPLRLNCDFELISHGRNDSIARWTPDYVWSLPYRPVLQNTRIEKLKVSIINETPNSEEVVENFREFLWLKYLPIELRIFAEPYECCDGRALKELQISCNMKHLKSYNVSTICFLHPNITVLKIGDGPEFNYRKGKDITLQYKGMSKACISDCDMKFILYSLVHLRELTIWANMSKLSDRGLLGAEDITTIDPINWEENEGYRDFHDLICLYKMESVSSCFSQRKLLSSVSISNLRELKVLSLRGVGDKITDAVTCSNDGLCSLKKLSSLEILWNHNITKRGQEMLRSQGIKEIRLK